MALLEELDEKMTDHEFNMIKENSEKIVKTIDQVEQTIE